MSHRAPDSQDHDQTVDQGAAGAVLVAAPWTASSAVGLVAVALVLTLLAGAVVSQMGLIVLNPTARVIAGGGVLLVLYAALLGLVWGASATLGVRLADAVGLVRVGDLRWYGAAIGAAVVGWLFSAGFTWLLSAIGARPPREDLAVFRVLPSGPLGAGITILLLVVVAPFAEEVIYRGVLLSSLGNRWGLLVGLIGSSAVFSAVHLSLWGFVPLFVAGALFGGLFIKSRSLWVAVVAHAAYNALGVVALLASKSVGVL